MMKTRKREKVAQFRSRDIFHVDSTHLSHPSVDHLRRIAADQMTTNAPPDHRYVE
jgi:hypothetical protein